MSDQGNARHDQPWTVVVMGVAGSGKTSLARVLTAELAASYVEADDHHPAANVAKMAAGEPLTDADRAPWLAALAQEIRRLHAVGEPVVLTCSALRRRYRDLLREADPRMVFVHLDGDPALILERMRQRDHFMPPALLDSQISTLEELSADEHHFVVDIAATPGEIARTVLERLGRFGISEPRSRRTAAS